MSILTTGFCSKSRQAETSKLQGRYTIALYDSIADVEENWSIVSSAHDIFFSVEFLRCIENFPATGIKPYYGLVKIDNEALGIIYFQSKYVRLKENLRKPGSAPKNMFEKLSEPIKYAVVSSINFQVIICGNLLLTGKYGFYFKDTVSKDEQFYLVTQAIDQLTVYLQKKGINPGLILIKDFFTEDAPVKAENYHSYTKFTVQPKMILKIKKEWKTFDDYLEDMKSKYRVRVRKALQKSADITKIVFNETDIASNRDIINKLYKNVSDQADFNAFLLHENYFENLKAALGSKMTFTTYWRQGKMVAFFTSIKNYEVLDAHFLGYDPTENLACQLYLNMLFDLIKEGLDQKMDIIDMSRTAVEIKSTVGALPYDMFLYLKHTNSLFNKGVGKVLGFVKPDASYVIRHPFRDSEED